MTASAGPALQRLHAEFGTEVAFVSLYVREAHPGERYPQPDTLERKLEHARDYRDRDGLPWPVAVDDVDGSLHRALDGKPNAAYLMDRDGHVVFRGLWSNVEAPLRRALEAALAGQRPPVAEDRSMLVPMLRGMGAMDEVFTEAGQVARDDVRREVPPVYAMARLAAMFRPLPPLARGIAAASIPLVAIVGGAVLLARLTGRRQ